MVYLPRTGPEKSWNSLTVFIIRTKKTLPCTKGSIKRNCSVMEESPCEKVPSPCLCFINSLTTFQRPSRHEFVTFCQTHKLLRKKLYIQLCASFSNSVSQALFATFQMKGWNISLWSAICKRNYYYLLCMWKGKK